MRRWMQGWRAPALAAVLAVLAAPGDAEAREIRWFAGPWGPTHHAWAGGLAEALTAFETVNDVSVEVIFHRVSADRHDQFLVNVAAGTPPDVISLSSLGFLPQLGLVTDLRPFIQRSDVGSFSDYPEILWTRLTVDDAVFAVPTEAIPSYALIYNRRLFDEGGLPYPDPGAALQWDDVWVLAQDLTRVGDGGTLQRLGIDPISATGRGVGASMVSWDARLLDEQGRPAVTEPEWSAALENAARPYWEYGVREVRALSGWADRLKDELVAMQINGPWVPRELEAFGFTGEVGYTWLPQRRGLRSQALSAWVLAMPPGIDDPDLAWRFIEWFGFGDGALARSRAEATPFVGPTARPDPNLVNLNEGIAWYVRSLSDADAFLAQDAHPIWGEADGLWRNEVVPAVIEREVFAGQALADFERALQNFLVEAEGI